MIDKTAISSGLISLVIAGLLVLLPASATYAHDCSSDSDCANVIRNNAWLTALLALITALAAAKGKKWKMKKPIKKRFKNCHEAAQWLKSGEFVGDAQAELERTYDDKASPTQQPDGTFKIEQKVKWSLNPDKSTMQLPDLGWKNMTNDDKKAIADFQSAVEAHEVGHMAVAQSVADEFSEKLLTGTGATADAAMEDFERRVRQQEQEVQKMLDKRGEIYEDATENGIKQSRIGGKDAILRCPPTSGSP